MMQNNNTQTVSVGNDKIQFNVCCSCANARWSAKSLAILFIEMGKFTLQLNSGYCNLLSSQRI